MRKYIVSLVALVAVFSTGCTIQVGDGGEATETPSASSTPSPSESESFVPEPGDMTREDYLFLLRETDPWLEGVEDDLLVENATIVCDSLDSGVSVDEVITMMVDSGIPAFSAGVLTQGAVLYKCPENQHMVDEYTGESSGSSI